MSRPSSGFLAPALVDALPGKTCVNFFRGDTNCWIFFAFKGQPFLAALGQ